MMVPTLLADMLLFLAGLYFFLATRHNIRFTVLSLCFSRRMRWRTAHVFRDVETKVSRFLLSTTVINLGVGVATSLAMWAIGMPSPLLWGALAAVLNFIPYVGQAIMLADPVRGRPGHVRRICVSILLPVAVYAAINLTADQLLFPHLVGKALTLNPFIIFVSIAFWMWLWGPMGGFVAVPSLLVLQSIVMHVFPIHCRCAQGGAEAARDAGRLRRPAKSPTPEPAPVPTPTAGSRDRQARSARRRKAPIPCHVLTSVGPSPHV